MIHYNFTSLPIQVKFKKYPTIESISEIGIKIQN